MKPKTSSTEAPFTSQSHAKSATSTLNSQQIQVQQKMGWNCQACGQGQHGLARCARYHQMKVEDRWEVVKKAGLCFQCLGPHRVRNCRSKRCPFCSGQHHTSLHRGDRNTQPRHQASEINPHAAPFVPSTGPSTGTAVPPESAVKSPYKKEEHGNQPPKGRYNAGIQCNDRFYQTALVKAMLVQMGFR